MTLPLQIVPGDPPPLAGVTWRRAIPSVIGRKGELIDGAIAELQRGKRLSDDDQHWLTLCLDEAVVNATLHGNEADETVEVVVQVAQDDQGWTIRIDDAGEGFDPTSVPDIDDSASLLLEHGRGIRLMREWLDGLRYYRNGATIEMHKRW